MLTYKEMDRFGDPLVLDKALKREISGYPDEVGCEAVAEAIGTSFAEIGAEVDQAVVEKGCALLLCHTSDSPWSDLVVFEKVTDALSGFEPDHATLEGSSPAQLSLAACVMKSLRPKMEYNNNVISYIRGIMRDNGIVCYPECLSFAQEEYLTNDLKELCKSVQERSGGRPNVEGITYNLESEAPIEVQLAKLSLVQEYVNGVIGTEKKNNG